MEQQATDLLSLGKNVVLILKIYYGFGRQEVLGGERRRRWQAVISYGGAEQLEFYRNTYKYEVSRYEYNGNYNEYCKVLSNLTILKNSLNSV